MRVVDLLQLLGDQTPVTILDENGDWLGTMPSICVDDKLFEREVAFVVPCSAQSDFTDYDATLVICLREN